MAKTIYLIVKKTNLIEDCLDRCSPLYCYGSRKKAEDRCFHLNTESQKREKELSLSYHDLYEVVEIMQY